MPRDDEPRDDWLSLDEFARRFVRAFVALLGIALFILGALGRIDPMFLVIGSSITGLLPALWISEMRSDEVEEVAAQLPVIEAWHARFDEAVAAGKEYPEAVRVADAGEASSIPITIEMR